MSTPAHSPPEQGQLIGVRSRQWVVNDVRASTLPPPALKPTFHGPQHLLTLASVEDDGLGEELQVIWEIEPQGANLLADFLLRPAKARFRTVQETEMGYKADLTAGALKVPESRVIADLLLRGVDEEGWAEAIVQKNVLQARSPKTAERLTLLIRGRLATMGPELWRLVRDGRGDVATHAVLAAAVKHSRLLADFLDLVVREQYRLYAQALSNKLWEDFLDGCRERDLDMPAWHESTRNRLRSSVFQALAQAGYVENTRSLKLQTVHVAAPVVRYLHSHGDESVLRCIQVAP